MITAQILGKTELDGVFKEILEESEEYGKLSQKDKEILIAGFAANICYTEKDMEEIVSKGIVRKVFEEIEKEKKVSAVELAIERANSCFESGHHSVADHKRYAIYFKGLPKLLAMILNNEKDYATSEKSARYTKMTVTKEEEEIYYKWIEILKIKILEKYPGLTNAEKLAQENARYMISVYTPTKMLYSASLRQLNYMIIWLKNSLTSSHPLYKKLRPFIKELIIALESLPIEQIKLQKNEKNRKLSLIEDNNYTPSQFGKFYALTYKGSFAQLAQAHRHRTLEYSLSLFNDFECYIPKIIRDDKNLVKVWKEDIEKLANNYPQGMLVQISEGGSIDKFVLKTKERLCGYAQLEICDQTKESLNILTNGYYTNMKETQNDLDYYFYKKIYKDLKSRQKGARCTQPDYTCPKPCGNKKAITLDRDI